MATKRSEIIGRYWNRQKGMGITIADAIEAKLQSLTDDHNPSEKINIAFPLEFVPEQEIFDSIKKEYHDAGWGINIILSNDLAYINIILS